jgi:hypothetical protein
VIDLTDTLHCGVGLTADWVMVLRIARFSHIFCNVSHIFHGLIVLLHSALLGGSLSGSCCILPRFAPTVFVKPPCHVFERRETVSIVFCFPGSRASDATPRVFASSLLFMHTTFCLLFAV